MVSRGSPGLQKHGLAFLAAALVVGVMGLGPLSSSVSHIRDQGSGITAEIGIEHLAPLSVTIQTSKLDGAQLVDIGNEDAEGIFVSVTEGWQRREVSGAPLEAVSADPPTFGFRRWKLPAGATISFRATPFESLRIHNPSGIPVKVDLTRVDLGSNETEKDVILIQDKSRVLW